MYQNELNALKKQNRFRERFVYDNNLIDFASNDYLGLAHSKEQFQKAIDLTLRYNYFAPKSSMLVGGYHQIHQMFENEISKLNGFENAIVVGSGFLANFALIESLVRKGDMLFIDEEYHASGMAALPNINGRFIKFSHNSPDDLRSKILQTKAKRIIIAIEGIYSMSGDICKKEFFDIADEAGAILIVDEAHSSGVLGDKLLGVFDHYGISPKPNYIKMGTLGKAYGSYGAYILASENIISFLENRAKPIIYSTAPSVFDIALALVNMRYIQENIKFFVDEIRERKDILREFGYDINSLIVPVEQKSNLQAMRNKDLLLNDGFLVGAIRQPTVKEPILRIIPRLGSSIKDLQLLFTKLAKSL
ncbi:MAG: 8-amino-7-oxononanoate synthase [Sulfurovum sp. AS07-7]|nr:MAG: 8-amino-7-oxononanoate synthase [Sulfurovum sp. AS07-7]